MTRATIFRLALLAFAAAAAVWLFHLGDVIHRQDERAALIAAIWRHVGWGVVLIPPLALYAVWRIASARALKGAARWTGAAAALVLLLLLVTGPVVVWTYGSDLKVFDWFVIPNPIGKSEAIHDPLEIFHVQLGRIAPLVLIADLLAAAVAALRRAR